MTSLTAPPRLEPDTLRIIPLGGLGDIGRNMTCFEINDEIVIVDCGVLFPEERHPGVDLILPGFDYLMDRLDDVVGMVLTHGHEDHIGAVPYLLRERSDIDIYGSALTMAFVGSKLREHRLDQSVLHDVDDGQVITLGGFEIEFFSVTHSIPDAMAVAITTSAGTVLHTGDFKMEQLPIDGRLTDLRGFARLADRGVDLLMADSTNATVTGFTPTDRELLPALKNVFASAQNKLVVACFASHVHRVQEIMNLAVAHGRKVAYVGRSMVRNMAIARDLGYLKVPGGTLIELSEIDQYADDEVVIICTGSQGEPLSALSRMANKTHRDITLADGDTVLLASSLIPGNENAVYRVINGLAHLGVNVVHQGNAFVHTSGHAAAGELLYLYNIVQPTSVMPIHGEARHLIANGDLAIATGVARDNTIIAEDGAVVDMADGRCRRVGTVDASYVFVDGSIVGDITEEQLTDRRILGEEGFISIICAVSLNDRTIVSEPQISARGFVDDTEGFEKMERELAATVQEALDEGVGDTYQLQQRIRRHIGRWVSKTYRLKPMIVPVVVAV